MSQKKKAAPKRMTNDQIAQRVFGKKIAREVKKAVKESDGDAADEDESDHEQKDR